jgi:hypothetical protein
MRLLEQKRFMEAIENLRHLLKAFNFAAQRKASVTTFPTWLDSLCLAGLRPKLDALGAFEVRWRRRGVAASFAGLAATLSPPLNTRPPT